MIMGSFPKLSCCRGSCRRKRRGENVRGVTQNFREECDIRFMSNLLYGREWNIPPKAPSLGSINNSLEFRYVFLISKTKPGRYCIRKSGMKKSLSDFVEMLSLLEM